MQKRIGLLFLSAILGGLLFNILGFWEQTIASFLFIIYLYGVFFIIIRPKYLSKMGIFLMVWILLLALTKGLYMADYLLPLNNFALILGFLVSVILLSTTYTENRRNFKIVQEVGGLFLRTPVKLVLSCQEFSKKYFSRMNFGLKNSMKNTLLKILIGILVAIPLLIVIYLLLSSADPIFKSIITNNIPDVFNRLQHLPSWLNGINIIQFLIISFSIISFSYQLYTHQKEKTQAIRIEKNIGLNTTTAATILIIINIIYFIFCYVQIRYLFGSSVLPAGFTYAQYAVQGFWQLVIINLINIGILLTMSAFVPQTKFIKTLLTIIFVCTSIIFVSGYQRMHLYLGMYGYSYERILSLSFMLLVGIRIIISFVKVFYQKFKVSQYYIIAFLLYYLIINYINIDKLVVNHNVERYHQTGKIDFQYLANSIRLYETLPKIQEFKINPEFLTALNQLGSGYNEGKTSCSTARYQTNFSCNKYQKLMIEIISHISTKDISKK